MVDVFIVRGNLYVGILIYRSKLYQYTTMS